MDYGDRQERALALVKAFREHPDQKATIYRDIKGQSYRAGEIADQIAEQTDFGTSIVAIAGFVFQARLLV